MVSTTHLACAKIAIIARVVTRWQLLVLTLTANFMQEEYVKHVIFAITTTGQDKLRIHQYLKKPTYQI